MPRAGANGVIFGTRFAKTQHADCTDRAGDPALATRSVRWNPIYSMIAASRPISLATSSSSSESCSASACASRARHSSSVIAGTSLGTIEGTGLKGAVWMSDIESPFANSGQHRTSSGNTPFWRSVGVAERSRSGLWAAGLVIFVPSRRAANHCGTTGFGAYLGWRRNGPFGPLQRSEALLYAARRDTFRLFLGSSAVEHSTVNRMVAGSNPARGAK
jgi:hypothetical protein